MESLAAAEAFMVTSYPTEQQGPREGQACGEEQSSCAQTIVVVRAAVVAIAVAVFRA